MQTTRQVVVYGSASRGHSPIGRIDYGAVLEVTPTDLKKGCKKGWVRLAEKGFVCSKDLAETTKPATASPADNPNIDEGIERYVVTRGGAMSFQNKAHFQRRNPYRFLYRGTVLAVKRTIERGGSLYLVTRDGQYVHGENVQRMNPVWSLGHLVRAEQFVVGYVIDDETPVYEAPDADAPIVRNMEKFETIVHDRLLNSVDDWVALPSGGYVSDASVARVREVDSSFRPQSDEKWIAVDLQEQIVAAYVGGRLVYVALASTGKKGNTETGTFRVKWKRRLQTMNLYGGHLRVDDVSWVMYYIPQRGFALHSAWHRDFGHPVSHGCVNLPRDDARWLYEWVAPTSAPYESENFHSDFEKGTRVIVF